MRRFLAGALALATLVAVSAALGARGYTDTASDVNTAPDITSLDVSEATVGVLTLKLTVGNYQTLPTSSWVNLWFDTDSNAQTGDEGDEALVRYVSTGALEVFVWDGSRFIEGSTDGLTAGFTAGALTLSVPRSSIGALSTVGILAVSSRAQVIGNQQLVASDFAPNVGRSSFSGQALTAFPDPANDHDAAPDITSVRVSDAKNGWVTFSITTPNYATLPIESAIVLSIDADGNVRTGEAGEDVRINTLGGEIALERWDARAREWLPDGLPTRARYRNAGNVVAIEVHVSELDNPQRLGFSLLSADVNSANFEVVAVDLAPDNGAYWSYALANKPALKLVFTRIITKPARPKAGKPFTVGFGVTRSDTGRGVTSGTVGCRVLSAEKKVPAKGRIAGGAGLCSFVVPKGAVGSLIRGTVTVRSGGKSIARDFAFVVH